MDKLSEYIPLLIIIASVIISLVRKAKQPAKEISLPKEVFPEIFQPSLVREPDPEIKIVEPVFKKAQVPEKKQQTISRKFVEVQDNDEYEDISIDFSEPDEMKKAIIYSEIFNRKD